MIPSEWAEMRREESPGSRKPEGQSSLLLGHFKFNLVSLKWFLQVTLLYKDFRA